jgi:hypothetical protein
LAVRHTAVDAATLSFFAERGLRYTISGSIDLARWQVLEVVDGTGAELTRSYPLHAPRQFFRVNLWLDPVADFSFMK